MSFHRRAWNAAADEYGRRRSERYGAYARAVRALSWLGAIALVLACIIAAHGGFGG